MTEENKPMMIDDVDVSKCKLYRDKVSFANGMTITDVCSIWIWQRDYSGLEPSCIMKCHCSNNSNCYYKQLQREKQTSQETRDTAIEEFNRLEELKTLLKRKEQECGKLEQKISNYKCPMHKNASYCGYLEEGGKLNMKLVQLKQTIAEIKEIAEENVRISELEGLNGVYRRGLAEQILQKINEVLNDR